LYLGVEAAAWISYFVLRESGNDRARLAEEYAGDPTDPLANWSFERYEAGGYCNAANGVAADSTIRYLWSRDRAAFYDLIENDPKYGCGWFDGEALGDFREMRSNSEKFLRWARYAGAAVLINHVMAVMDMLRASQGFQVPGGMRVDLKLDASPAHPSGTIKIMKAF